MYREEDPWFMMSQKFENGVSLICGDRKIIMRPSTGEQGEKGPFPFIMLAEKDVEEGRCIFSEIRFSELWDKLKELMPSE